VLVGLSWLRIGASGGQAVVNTSAFVLYERREIVYWLSDHQLLKKTPLYVLLVQHVTVTCS
jgi:hypothetical protein